MVHTRTKVRSTFRKCLQGRAKGMNHQHWLPKLRSTTVSAAARRHDSPVVENRAVDREGESAKHLLGPAAAGQQAGRHEASKARGWVGCARWASLRGTSLPNVRT